MRLKNRIAVVTGGSSGIGRGICVEFAREGARVVAADIEEAPKRGKFFETDDRTATVEEIESLGGEGIFVRTDVADEDAVRGLIDRTVSRFGGIDILVNNAGINIHGKSQEVAVADWDRVIAVDLRGMFLTMKFAIPHITSSQHGRIINISSVMALCGRQRAGVLRRQGGHIEPDPRYVSRSSPRRCHGELDLPLLHRDRRAGLPDPGAGRCREAAYPVLEIRDTKGHRSCLRVLCL